MRMDCSCLIRRHVTEVGERGLAALSMIAIGVKPQAVTMVVAPFQPISGACLMPFLAIEAPGLPVAPSGGGER